jgi:catechol 2,3-dioxygenase-like lactoylglutathione lyase family enzyme
MTQPRIEHVNVTVSDIDRTASMLMELFGWRVRWRGLAANGGSTIHVGDDVNYLAVYAEPGGPHAAKQHAKGRPLNHIGIEVDDLGEIERKVKAFGLKPFGHGDYEPGRRFYFFDADGIEYEIVSYA